MASQSYSRLCCACAIASLIALFAAYDASAQSITAARIATTLSLDAQDLPVAITHVYELGRVQAVYSSNGSYTEPASQSLGKLESIVIFGTTVGYSIIDNETTPGTGRTVLVSFTSTREGDGTVTAKIEAEAVAN